MFRRKVSKGSPFQREKVLGLEPHLSLIFYIIPTVRNRVLYMSKNSPAQGTVIYDGNCTLCTAFVSYFKQKEIGDNLWFVQSQRCDLGSISPGLTSHMARKSVFFIRPDGQRFSGARAVYESWKSLSGLLGLVGMIMSFPPLSVLSQPIYRLVASRRHFLAKILRIE